MPGTSRQIVRRMTLSLLVAAGFALAAIATLVALVSGYRRVPKLRDVPPATLPVPGVSIVIAARDEERHVEAAVESLLRLDYPHYELIVVNDRSADRTAEILERIAAREPRLQIVTVRELPAGWLGKNHALQLGAGRARNELLLFADGDVIFEPKALLKAVALLQRETADHLTIAPELLLPSAPLALVINYLFMYGVLALRPWKASDPKSSASAGIGAFNLMRASTYRAVGMHERIRLRPDDDLMIGRVIKRAGFRQIVAIGLDEVRIEWYRTLGEAARGFRKNSYASLAYNPLFAVIAVGSNLLGVWPFIAVFTTEGATRALYLVTVLAWMTAFMYHGAAQRLRPWLAPFYPVAALITSYIIAAAVGRTLLRGGIEWRGTFYPLAELKRNRV
jgi:glycosyltransferase involved in cell wall biosynthesis